MVMYNLNENASEKIIPSQEKNIQKLNELVRSFRKQLLQCRSNSEATNDTLSSLAANVIELKLIGQICH